MPIFFLFGFNSIYKALTLIFSYFFYLFLDTDALFFVV